MTFPDLPEWVTAPFEQDPISMQYNVVEPLTEVKMTGFVKGQRPPRQYLNWLHHQTYLCLEDLQTKVGRTQSGTFAPIWDGFVWDGVTGTDVVVDPNYCRFTRIYDVVYLTINFKWDGNSDAGTPPPLIMTNLPFPALVEDDYVSTISLEKVNLSVNPTENALELSGRISNGSSNLEIQAYVASTGIGIPWNRKGTLGQFILTGSYFIDPLEPPWVAT